MFKSIQFQADPTAVFFISDLHHHHDRDFIWGRRGFTSVQESDRVLIQRWNETVSHDGTVFHLGDLIFKDGGGEGFMSLVNRLNFSTLYLLTGNHTSGQKQVYQRTLESRYPGIEGEVYPLRLTLGADRQVIFLPEYAEVTINGRLHVLCHYPIASFNAAGKGAFHLSGHCHGNLAASNPQTGVGFQMDVGVECWGCPVSLARIEQHFSTRKPVTLDHH